MNFFWNYAYLPKIFVKIIYYSLEEIRFGGKMSVHILIVYIFEEILYEFSENTLSPERERKP